jgi:hypothetical protein
MAGLERKRRSLKIQMISVREIPEGLGVLSLALPYNAPQLGAKSIHNAPAGEEHGFIDGSIGGLKPHAGGAASIHGDPAQL